MALPAEGGLGPTFTSGYTGSARHVLAEPVSPRQRRGETGAAALPISPPANPC